MDPSDGHRGTGLVTGLAILLAVWLVIVVEGHVGTALISGSDSFAGTMGRSSMEGSPASCCSGSPLRSSSSR